MSVSSNIQKIRKTIPPHVELVCVSKFHPADAVMEAYNAGERIFGESKVQELAKKHEELPEDISWHFIGHLQSNKIKYIIPFVGLIHGIDSVKLLSEVNKQAAKAGRVVGCLLQVHIAQEETKFGFDASELRNVFCEDILKGFTNVSVRGLMGMATFTDDSDQVRLEFRGLKEVFDEIKSRYFPLDNSFSILSMGMSDDYSIAIEEGSTMVRIGTTIFGNRAY